ncbi:MAG: hypothetical protein IMF19_15540 [Proteobacteria bacterium]|nr:hypothetical protein [Pseudomonadota bacterium]
MALIHLKEGGTFFGRIKDYDWKGKFLVVEIDEIKVNDKPDCRIISWDNVESVYDTDYDKEENK